MKKKLLILTVLASLSVLLTFSCKKQKEVCMECTANCSGGETKTSKQCSTGLGDGTSDVEAKFRAANPGCDIKCTKK
ncbi:hypothetical protein [Pedobacter caeni]|uniref:Uncharacterized protein n=1 Tax=Pedobacter caeni TaxID=288992 RepID=A0A1M4ZVK7_9SPHI|nr:hypothetical protein [Pedobacter caeni]SHF21847.1 hypothetical protein SAMN04488522_102476 [Pedobacter caeni]